MISFGLSYESSGRPSGLRSLHGGVRYIWGPVREVQLVRVAEASRELKQKRSNGGSTYSSRPTPMGGTPTGRGESKAEGQKPGGKPARGLRSGDREREE